MTWLDDDEESKARKRAKDIEQAARSGVDRIDSLIRSNISELGRRTWGEDAFSIERRFDQVPIGTKAKHRCRWLCIGVGTPQHSSDTRLYYYHVDVVFSEDGEVDVWGSSFALSRSLGRTLTGFVGQAFSDLAASAAQLTAKVNPLNETALRIYLKDQFKEGPHPLFD